MKNAVTKLKKPVSTTKIAGVDDRKLDQLVEVFKSAADRSRLLILMILAEEGETHVSAICEMLGQSQPAVSHHLTQLRNAGLVTYRRDGKFNHYMLDSSLVADLFAAFFPGSDTTQQRVSFGELEVAFKAK
ncbi:MAG: metalloregulator ArsR/SmtB family transcription factor [Planctomycetes bacterium]|nr:metalloregulator ArsR/SmtB family transcription factor [Planctomycetota bacterium]